MPDRVVRELKGATTCLLLLRRGILVARVSVHVAAAGGNFELVLHAFASAHAFSCDVSFLHLILAGNCPAQDDCPVVDINVDAGRFEAARRQQRAACLHPEPAIL